MTRIHFCKSFDGARIAYANAGRGPAMVEVATWLNHLEHDWKSPVWGPRLAELSNHFSLTRYDSRGCGLSDRNVESLTFDGCLRDLEAVVDAAGLKHFVLLGCCQGSGLAIAYAARHPERVSHLVLYGAFARGRMKRDPSPRDIDEANTMLKLVELGWGCGNPAFRQVFTTMFIPGMTILLTSFIVVTRLSMLDTLAVLVIPGAAAAGTVFFIRQFYLNIPASLEEAASAVSLYALGPYWLQAVAPDYGVVRRYSDDRLPRPERRAIFARMTAESGRALWETLNWWLDPFMTTSVAAPGCPVLAVAGGQDVIHPPATVRQTAARLGGSLEVFPEMSHWLPGEPGWEKVAERCLAFIAAEDRAAA